MTDAHHRSEAASMDMTEEEYRAYRFGRGVAGLVLCDLLDTDTVRARVGAPLSNEEILSLVWRYRETLNKTEEATREILRDIGFEEDVQHMREPTTEGPSEVL